MDKVKLLLVDDLEENLTALEAVVRDEGVEVYRTTSGMKALELLLEHDFALALVDVQMPIMNGFELAELMRGTERTRHVPIIFVTAASRSPGFAFKGYDSGAVDFLYKPLDAHVVRSKVRVFIELQQQRQALREQLRERGELLDRLQEQVQRLTVAEQKLQKAVVSRDEFLSIASHELNTPITSLKLHTQLTKHRITSGEASVLSPESLVRTFDQTDRQVDRLVTLVDALLDVSRIQSGRLDLRFVEFDLRNSLLEVVERFRPQAAKAEMSIELECSEGITVDWDRLRFEQVVANLVSNAIKYAPGAPLRLSVLGGRDRIRLTVQDFGPGIDPSQHALIFERFERGGNASAIGGLGLGLYIVKQIVDAHAGKIRVTSAVGEGTQFIVELPRHASNVVPFASCEQA